MRGPRSTLATAVRESVPRHVAAAIQKSLAKLSADRFGTAAAMAEALGRPGWADTGTSESAAAEVRAPVASRKLVAGLGALALLATAAALWGWLRPEPAKLVSATYVKFAAGEAPAGGVLVGSLAPDGSALAYLGPGEAGTARIWIKQRNELHATPLAGRTRLFHKAC